MVVNETGTLEKSAVLKKIKKTNFLSSVYACVKVKVVAADSEDLYWKKRKLMQMSKTWSVSVSLSLRPVC